MTAIFTSQLGRLPAVPDRTVVFVANLQSIFFDEQEETQLLADTVNGIDSYGGRLLPILQLLYPGNRNLLVLERAPAAELLTWYHDVLGLKTPETTVLPHRLYCDSSAPRTLAVQQQIHRHPAAYLDGYVTDQRLAAIAANTGKQTCSTPSASRCGNNKLLLHRHLVANNLPHFDTVEVDSSASIPAALNELRSRGFATACLKAAVGASGIGLMKVSTDTPPQAVPAFFFDKWPCLVQGWEDTSKPEIEAIESPSVQLWLDDDTIIAYDLTSQILSPQSIHEGNSAPPPWQEVDAALVERILQQAEVAAKWLYDVGYRGAASIDFHLAWLAGCDFPTVRICEINARVTGATYPAILARHFLSDGAWHMQNLHFHVALPGTAMLAALHKSGLAFSPGKAAGLLPINFNLDDNGLVQKCQMLALGADPVICANQIAALATVFPGDFIHDRD